MVKDYNFLDEVGLQQLAGFLLQKVNARISSRIITDPAGNDSAKVDDNHIISAATVMQLIGDSEGNLGEDIADLEGKLTALTNQVQGFTHLKIKTHIGNIEEVADPELNTFYFQKDAPYMDTDEQGFILNEGGERVTANDGTDYYAKVDEDGKVYKHNGTDFVLNEGQKIELSGEDTIFTTAKVIEDLTWTIYAYVMTTDDPDEPEAPGWVNFGDFDVALENYWSKDPESVEELRQALSVPNVNPIDEDAIRAAVDDAFTETAPDFEPAQVAIVISFKKGEEEVGTWPTNVDNGVQVTINYTDMTVPEGYAIADTDNTGITFTTYSAGTIEVEVIDKPGYIKGVTAKNATYNGSPVQGYEGTPTAAGFAGVFEITYDTDDAQAPTKAGSYNVTFKIPDGEAVSGTLTLPFTVDKANVTVTGPTLEINKDEPAPDLGAQTAIVSGTVGSDSFEGVTLAWAAGDPDTSVADVYEIVPSGGSFATGEATNYNVNYVNGTLTVVDPGAGA